MVETSLPTAARNLVADAIATLRKLRGATGDERTAILRRVADNLVALREFFLDEHGDPDWRGRTYAYRQAVRDIYAESGLTSDPNDRTKAAIRYHVGNSLRDRLSQEELTLHSLNLLTPRDRQRARYNPEADMPPEDIISTIYFLLERLTNDPDSRPVDKYTYNRAAVSCDRLNEWVSWQHKLISEK